MPAKKTTKKSSAKASFIAAAILPERRTAGLDTPDDDIVGVPFARYGCAAHKVHKPTPTASRVYRIFPARSQREVYGEIRDHDRIALCGTGATDADYAFQALVSGKALPRGVGTAEAAIAREGFRRYQAATADVPTPASPAI